MPKYYDCVCAQCHGIYRGRGKYYCSNKCASKIENKKKAGKISLSLKGKAKTKRWKHTEEWKRKARLWQVGNKSNTGKKLSIELRKKLSTAHIGEKAYNWKGGVSSNNTRSEE